MEGEENEGKRKKERKKVRKGKEDDGRRKKA